MSAPAEDPVSTDVAVRALLTCVWVAFVVVVGPIGNFPLNDDWSYARAVLSLVQDHTWRLTDFTSMPLATQLLWGALFCMPAGFSFDALRASTLVLGWLGVLGAYQLVRDAGNRRGEAAAAALTVAFCPVYAALAFSFMTDVPFAALAIWAAVLALRYARAGRTRDLIATIALLTAATLVRQLGAALAVGAAAGAGAAVRPRRVARAAAIAMIPIAALVAYDVVLNRIGAPWYYHRREAEWVALLLAPGTPLRTVLTRAVQVAVTLGLFLAPAALAFGVTPATRRGRTASIVVAVVLGSVLAVRRHALPLVGNILFDAGLSPVVIDGAETWPAFPPVVWVVATAFAVAIVSAAAARAGESLLDAGLTRRIDRRRGHGLMLGAMLAASVAPLLVTNLFDRYLLLPLTLTVGVLPALGREGPRRWMRGAALAILAALALFDIAALHDTFAFNRARWDAVELLRTSGAAAESIDGGFEVNGWLSYRRDWSYADSGPWWTPKAHPTALLSLVERPKYRVIARFSFRRWLSSAPGAVYVLEPELL